MNRPKLPLHLPLRTTGIALLWVALIVSVAWLFWQLHQVRAVLEHAADQDSIAALSKRLSAAETRLEGDGVEQPVSDADFRAAQQALSNRLDSLTSSLQELRRGAAGLNDVVMLEVKVEQLTTDLQDLRKIRLAPSPVLPAKPKPRLTPKPRPAEPALVAETPPPFHIIGLEYRGGERFLSVAPQGSTSLSDIYLVRPGDTVGGTRWRLNGIDGNRAQFAVDGTSRALSLTP